MTKPAGMACFRRWSVLVLIMVMMLGTTTALFKEQAGKYDWLKQNIGFIDHAHIVGSRAFVASNNGVVGAIDVTDGSLLWRAVLDEGETVTGIDASDDIAVIVTAASHVRAFGRNGQQLWEQALRGEHQCSGQAAIAVAKAGSTDIAIIACGEILLAVQLSSGERVWGSDLPAGNAQSVAVHPHSASSSRATVAMVDASSSGITVAVVDLGSGELSQITTSSGTKLDSSSVQALEHGAMALTADKTKVCAIEFTGTKSLTCQSVKSLIPQAPAASTLAAGTEPSLSGSCNAERVLQTSQGAAVLVLQDGGSLRAVVSKEDSKAGCAGSTAVSAAVSNSNGLEVTLYKASSGAVVKTKSSHSLQRTAVDGSLLGVSAVFAGSDEEGVLVQLAEGSLAYFSSASDSDPVWVRDEALASISDLIFAELPAPTQENEAQWAAQQPSTSDALRMQLLALKVQVGIASEEEAAAVERHATLTSDRLRPTRDPDGFRRLLLVTTAVGKVFGLHTGDGRVLWTLDFGAHAAPGRLAPWLTPHDISHDALVVAITSSIDSVIATVINTHTGKAVRSERVPAKNADVIQLPHPIQDDSGDQYVYIVTSDSSKPVVVPDSEAARTSFVQQAPGMVRWRVTGEGTAVEGLGVSSTGVMHQLWRVAAAPEGSGMQILSAASRNAEEAVYSAARPVFGGGILMKNLSPNTLLVVAGLSKGSLITKDSKLVATLIDAASGRVLFTQIHNGAAGPVHTLASEHWAAYHFWSSKLDRWQIAVIDSYRPAPPGLSVWDLALGRSATNTSESAYASDEGLVFERQVFSTKLPAATLGVTRTAHGTTAKMMLLGTPAGQVYMVDRRLLDPRRPHIAPGTKPTPAQAAEGLPPYAPELSLAGSAFATMDLRIARLRTVTTAPAVLESASLLVAVGLDIFYIRLQPSRGFDMVPEDFPFALLVAMVAGMTVALGVLRAMMQQRALKLKWQ